MRRRVVALIAVRYEGDDPQWLAVGRQVGETMNLEAVDEIIESLRARFPWIGASSADVQAEAGVAVASAQIAGAGVVISDADVTTATEGESVTRLEDLSDLSAKAAREGIGHLTRMDVLTLVLVWLLTIGSLLNHRSLRPWRRLMSGQLRPIGFASAYYSTSGTRDSGFGMGPWSLR
jgi:hypothetical protein